MSTKNWREEPRHRPPVCGKYSSGILSEDSVINITDAIYSAQIRVLYRHTPMVLTVNVVNSALVALVLASYMEQTRWWIFFGSVVALTGLRAIGWTCYRHYRKPVDATAKWGIAATAGSALSGLLWGVGSTLLLPDNIVEQTFLAFVIGGMCAGALVSLSYYLPAFLAYVSSAVLPLAASFLLDGRTVYAAMGGMTVVFVAALTFAAYHFNRAFVRGLRLNLDLSERTGELAHRTEELTTLNSRLEAEISQRKIAENQLHQAQKMEALGQLTGGIAHDFNNLLTAVIGNLELAQKRSGSDPHTAGLLEAALSAAERGATLIKDLLTFARRQPLHPKAVDVSAVVDDAEKILKQTHRSRYPAAHKRRTQLTAGMGRPEPAGARYPEPGLERAGCDAKRRQAPDSLREPTGRNRQLAVRPRHRRLRSRDSVGQRQRNERDDVGARLALFYDEGRGPRLWPGFIDGARVCGTVGGNSTDRELAWRRYECGVVAAARRRPVD